MTSSSSAVVVGSASLSTSSDYTHAFAADRTAAPGQHGGASPGWRAHTRIAPPPPPRGAPCAQHCLPRRTCTNVANCVRTSAWCAQTRAARAASTAGPAVIRRRSCSDDLLSDARRPGAHAALVPSVRRCVLAKPRNRPNTGRCAIAPPGEGVCVCVWGENRTGRLATGRQTEALRRTAAPAPTRPQRRWARPVPHAPPCRWRPRLCRGTTPPHPANGSHIANPPICLPAPLHPAPSHDESPTRVAGRPRRRAFGPHQEEGRCALGFLDRALRRRLHRRPHMRQDGDVGKQRPPEQLPHQLGEGGLVRQLGHDRVL